MSKFAILIIFLFLPAKLALTSTKVGFGNVNIGNHLIGLYKTPSTEENKSENDVIISTGLLLTSRWVLSRETFKTSPFQTGNYFAFLLDKVILNSNSNSKTKVGILVNPRSLLYIKPIKTSHQRLIVTWISSPFFNRSGYEEDNLALLQLEYPFRFLKFRQLAMPVNLKDTDQSNKEVVPIDKSRKNWNYVFFAQIEKNTTSFLQLISKPVQVLSRQQCLQEAAVKGQRLEVGYTEMCVYCNVNKHENCTGDGLLFLNNTPFAIYSRVALIGNQNNMNDIDVNVNATLNSNTADVQASNWNKKLLILGRLDLHWDFVRGIIPKLLINDDLISFGKGKILSALAEYKLAFVAFITVVLFIL